MFGSRRGKKCRSADDCRRLRQQVVDEEPHIHLDGPISQRIDHLEHFLAEAHTRRRGAGDAAEAKRDVRLGMELEGPERALEMVVLPEVVRVEEGDDVAGSGLDPTVPGMRDAHGALERDHARAGIAGDAARRIRGSVVHDDDLTGRTRLRPGRTDRIREEPLAVTAGNYD